MKPEALPALIGWAALSGLIIALGLGITATKTKEAWEEFTK